ERKRIARSPDGRLLARVREDRQVELSSPNAPGVEQRLRTWEFQDTITHLDFSPDSRWLAAVCENGLLGLWELATGKVHYLYGRRGRQVTAFSPDSRRFASSNPAGSLTVSDLTSGKELLVLSKSFQVTAIAFSPDGLHLAGVGFPNLVRLWDAWTGQQIAS